MMAPFPLRLSSACRHPKTSLIPVLVTGIQPRRVRAVNERIYVTLSPAPKDLGALDSCDKRRNEESGP